MSIVSVSEDRDAQTGEHGMKGEKTMTRSYVVVTDSASDRTETVLASTDLPTVGDTYSAGSESSSEAICKTKAASRISGSVLRWKVLCTYSTSTPEDEDPGEQPGDGDPLEEPTTISAGEIHHTAIVTKGIYRGDNGDGNSPFTPKWGEECAITNSAGVAFDPPLTVDQASVVVTFERNELTFNADLAASWANALNKTYWVVTTPDFRVSAAPWHAKVLSVRGRRRFRKGKIYWRTAYEILVSTDELNPEVLDRGAAEWLNESGDPQESPSDVMALKAITGSDGVSVGQLVNLDGRGKKLAAGADPVYLKFQVETNEIDFADFKLP